MKIITTILISLVSIAAMAQQNNGSQLPPVKKDNAVTTTKQVHANAQTEKPLMKKDDGVQKTATYAANNAVANKPPVLTQQKTGTTPVTNMTGNNTNSPKTASSISGKQAQAQLQQAKKNVPVSPVVDYQTIMQKQTGTQQQPAANPKQ